MALRDRDHRAQETVRIRKEIEMRVERVDRLAFLRNDDDQPLARDPAQFGLFNGEGEET